MINFDFYKYLNLKDNQVLKIKLKSKDDWLFVKRVSKSMIQSNQPAHTPITKINFEVIKDLDLYKRNKHDEDNLNEIMAEPEEVEQVEIIEV